MLLLPSVSMITFCSGVASWHVLRGKSLQGSSSWVHAVTIWLFCRRGMIFCCTACVKSWMFFVVSRLMYIFSAWRSVSCVVMVVLSSSSGG